MQTFEGWAGAVRKHFCKHIVGQICTSWLQMLLDLTNQCHIYYSRNNLYGIIWLKIKMLVLFFLKGIKYIIKINPYKKRNYRQVLEENNIIFPLHPSMVRREKSSLPSPGLRLTGAILLKLISLQKQRSRSCQCRSEDTDEQIVVPKKLVSRRCIGKIIMKKHQTTTEVLTFYPILQVILQLCTKFQYACI